MTLIDEFDLCGPLPTGVTVLEASAGTGKTYTIAGLAARYVAEGMRLDELLLITFTRMATGELRDRVRERLVACEDGLARVLAASAADSAPPQDEVIALLAEGDPDEVERRRERLARAVADFDAATIATTHGFCQEVLAELGTLGDLDPDVELVEDVSDLVAEVHDDLYVRAFKIQERPEGFSRARTLGIARAAAEHPAAPLEPARATPGSPPARRVKLAEEVRKELELRKRARGLMTYDDLQLRLRAILGGANGAAAAERLRSRFKVVLVDEFQDTDRVQLGILQMAFAQGGVTLVLIADPKQAIYAFRGADVYAYLTAVQAATRRATLRTNRRSDGPLLRAYDALFGDARLGHPEIIYRVTRPAPGHECSRLTGAPVPAALRVRVVHRDDVPRTPAGYASAPGARAHIARDLAAEAVRLLDAGASIGGTPVSPGDLAVLVRTHSSAELIQSELEAARVPAVINGAGTVFASPAARQWLRLLDAVDRPSSPARARTVALTDFLHWSAEEVAEADETAWEDVHRRLHRWSRILRDAGVAELAETVMVEENIAARLLERIGGERRLTDLRHVGQLLHRAASTERLGATALRGWLAERIAAGEERGAEDEQTRRLESDADAVQVLTIHRSKGLEFPIVFCPSLWEPTWMPPEKEPVWFHDADRGHDRTLDVGLEGRTYEAHLAQHVREQRGEDLRLMYVALTRARHQAIVWWAGSFPTRDSPLTRLVFARDGHGNVAASWDGTPSDAAVMARFGELAALAPKTISVEHARLGAPAAWSPPPASGHELHAASFDRTLDLRWRRTSYSDITAAVHDAWVESEPEERQLRDEPDEVEPSVGAAAGAAPLALGHDLPSPFAALPAGVSFGTFCHRVFESADFAAADLEAELGARVAEAARRTGVELGDPAVAVTALAAALRTPLGAVLDDVRLADVARDDRLDELDFELPLAGGEAPAGGVTPRAVAALLREHLPAEDPMRPYAERLEDPALRSSVRGFLTGTIDLVLRLPNTRFAIVDYKTNWLGAPGEELTLGHYAPGRLAAEMVRAHYGLQALLYTVALHRYLRWRIGEGYDPGRHIAGVLYLFVRGMAGESTAGMAERTGVFAWRPPGALVAALSDLLDAPEARAA